MSKNAEKILDLLWSEDPATRKQGEELCRLLLKEADYPDPIAGYFQRLALIEWMEEVVEHEELTPFPQIDSRCFYCPKWRGVRHPDLRRITVIGCRDEVEVSFRRLYSDGFHTLYIKLPVLGGVRLKPLSLPLLQKPNRMYYLEP
jgi:hypothetical protein